MAKRRYLPANVTDFVDRHGKRRYRFRRKGLPTYCFKSEPGSAEFLSEHRACLANSFPPVGSRRIVTGSVHDLIARFYASPAWRGNMKPSSQNTYRGIIERFRSDHGDEPISMIKTHHLDAILGKMTDRPAAANNLRKVLKRLFGYAVKIGMRSDNPAALTDAYKTNVDGFHTWTEIEITQYESHHTLGTKARLALALLLYTGQRRSDVVKMGRQHVKDGRISLRQTKTGSDISIPLHHHLQAAIDAMPSNNMTFLVT